MSQIKKIKNTQHKNSNVLENPRNFKIKNKIHFVLVQEEMVSQNLKLNIQKLLLSSSSVTWTTILSKKTHFFCQNNKMKETIATQPRHKIKTRMIDVSRERVKLAYEAQTSLKINSQNKKYIFQSSRS